MNQGLPPLINRNRHRPIQKTHPSQLPLLMSSSKPPGLETSLLENIWPYAKFKWKGIDLHREAMDSSWK